MAGRRLRRNRQRAASSMESIGSSLFAIDGRKAGWTQP
jgi:hypothetical protein